MSIIADGIATSTIMVQTIDAFDNNLITGGAAIALSQDGSATLSVVTDNADGTYTATLFGTLAESVNITGTLTGVGITDTAAISLTPGTVDTTTSLISVLASPISTDGGATTTITVQAKDNLGNDLTSGGSIIVLSQDGSAIISGVTDVGDGTYTATISNAVAEAITISATIDGNPVTDTEAMAFTAGVLDETSSIITVSASNVTTDGGATVTITVQEKDAQGNNVSDGGQTVLLSQDKAAVLGGVTDNGDGTYTAIISDTTAETVTVSGTMGGNTITDTAIVNFDPGAATTANSTVNEDSSSAIADGVSSTVITIQTVDAQGNNLTTGGDTVTVSGNGSATLTAVADNGNGTYTTSVTNTTVELITITATLNGPNITDTASVNFVSAAPGSITNNIRLWVQADAGVIGTTEISDWEDQSGTNHDLSQGNSTFRPSLITASSAMNFHQSVDFDGDRDHLADDLGITSFSSLSFYAVMRADSMSARNKIFEFEVGGGAGDHPHVGFNATGNIIIDDDAFDYDGDGTLPTAEPVVFSGHIDYCAPTEIKTWINANEQVDPDSPGLDCAMGTGDTNIGGSADASDDLDGQIAEFILYATELATSERRRIESYLAIKYGITLDRSYRDSSDATVYQLDGTYDSGIFGVAKDTSGALDQRISRSVNDTSGLIISTDSDFTSANASHTNSISNNGYLLTGHDGGSTATTQVGDISADYTKRVIREWKVTRTGTVNSVNMRFGTLPALAGNETYVLLEDADGVFTVGETVLSTSTSTTFENVSFSAGTNYFTIAVTEASVTNATISVSSANITADGVTTATITVQAKDNLGTDVTWGGLTIALAEDGDAIISAVTDNNDGTYTATISDATAEFITITGTMGGLGITDTATITFDPGAIDVATSTISVSDAIVSTDGGATSTITLQVKDAQGNNIQSGGDAITFSENGSAIISGITDNLNGSYTATISDTVAEIITITGTINGPTLTDNAIVTFDGGAADETQTTISVSSGTVTTDGGTTATITVQTKDAQGNNLTVGGETIVLFENGSATIGSITYAGGGSYTATISDTVAEPITISGTLGGNLITDTTLITFTVGALNAANSLISASPISVSTDGGATSTITVQARDAQGNNVTLGGATVALLEDGSATISTVTDNGNGTYTATIVDTTAEFITITATIDAGVVTDSTTVTFNPGIFDATQSTISASPTSVSTDGGATSTITIQIKDSQGNNISTGGQTVVLNDDGSAAISAVIDNGDGTYTATVSNSLAETITVSGTVDGNPITDTDNVTFTIGATEATASIITVANSSVTTDGGASTTITLQVKDAQNNNISIGGSTIVFSANGDALISAVIDNGNGTYSATIADLTAESITISATIDGNPVTDTAAVTFTPGAIDATQTTISVSSASVPTEGGATSSITVQAKDVQGNNLTSGGEIVLLSENGSAIISSVFDNGNGTYTATISDSVVEIITITGTIGGSPIADNAVVTFTIGAANASTTTIDISSATVSTDGGTTAIITVQAIDAQGNNITTGGSTVVLTENGSATIGVVTDNGNGTYTASISNSVAEPVTISGTIDSVAINDTATITFIPGIADATQTTIIASPTTVTADGTSASTITVQVKDAQGNNLTIGSDTIALSDNGNAIITSVTDMGDGTYTATMTNTSAEAIIVSGTLNAIAIPNTTSVTFATGVATITQSTISVSPASAIANGISTSTITLQAKDALGNNLTTGGNNVTLSTDGSATIGAITDNGDGTYTAIISSTTAESIIISGTLDGPAIVDTAAITFIPGSASVTTTTIMLAPS
ncbi:MAG: hypothetical protein JKY93_12655, partial [Gammaproteobacteria bacterium]|nr:hypothetical protein [Gammaproteobacteria bacterium]